jgi:hypothetical protein
MQDILFAGECDCVCVPNWIRQYACLYNGGGEAWLSSTSWFEWAYFIEAISDIDPRPRF